MRVVAEQEGDVEDFRLGHEIADRARRGHGHVAGADLQRFDVFALVVRALDVEADAVVGALEK
jgi:hypothetical protein